MGTWRAYPSAVTTEVNSLPDTVIDGIESVGSPRDAAATSNNSTNSVFALLKGICDGLGVAAGIGDGMTNTHPKLFDDHELTLGERSDGPAVDAAGTNSSISLMKGILVTAGL
jgi:hypothetical protein